MSCIGRNSGVSRNRPEREEFKVKKLPKWAFPAPREKFSPIVPNDPYVALNAPKGFVAFRPDLVTAVTTRLALSPYSGGGAPVIASNDWTACKRIWVDA